VTIQRKRGMFKKVVQQGRRALGARSVRGVREHAKSPRTQLAAFFNIPRKGRFLEVLCSVKRARSVYLSITPSGWRKTIVHPEHMVKIKLKDGQLHIPEGSTPSGELYMHSLLTKDNPKTRAVVHVHSTPVVAAMYRGFDFPHSVSSFRRSIGLPESVPLCRFFLPPAPN